MKAVLASIFVLSAACFFGWSLSTLSPLPPVEEIVVMGVEKGQVLRPSEVMFIQKRREWSI